MLKKYRSLLSKGSIVKSNIIVAFCFILIAANVGVFIFLPKILAPLALVISNVVTVVLMIAAFQPINHVMQSILNKKEDEIYERKKAEKELSDKIASLEHENLELTSKLDTWGQMSSTPASINFSAKLETMLYEKKGYIVKEEPVQRLVTERPKSIRERYLKWKDDFIHSGEKTVLYIGRQYASKTLGIDFSKVKYAFEDGHVALYGASITKIHNLEIVKDKGDIEHCWVLNNDPEKVSINTAEHYSEIPQIYADQCRKDSQEEVDTEVDFLCKQYTAMFRDCLSKHFPGVVFCDSIEDSTSTWYALNENSQDKRVAPIAAGMFLVANVLKSFNVSLWKELE